VWGCAERHRHPRAIGACWAGRVVGRCGRRHALTPAPRDRQALHHRRHSRHGVARSTRLDRVERTKSPVCRFAQVPGRDAAMLDMAESDREGSSYDRRVDPSGAGRVRVDRENDRMVLRARPAIRSRIRQPSLARRTTFLTGSCLPTPNVRCAGRHWPGFRFRRLNCSETPSANGAHLTALTLVLPLVVSKQLQVDGIRQCVVSQVVWVPVVSAIVESTDLGRGSGIT
jgi:hypothetical protein